MKIAHISCVYPPNKSGISRAAEQFALATAKLGHKVTVFTPGRKNFLEQNDNNLVEVIRLKPIASYGHGAFILSLWPYLNNYNVVWLHYPFFGGAEVVWLKKFFSGGRFRLFLHYHMDVSGLPWPVQILSCPSRFILKSLVKQAEIISAGSLDYVVNSALGKLHRQYENKFKEIPFAVETKRFKPRADKGKEAGKGKEKKKIILFVGGLDRAHYFKGVNILLRAVSQLKDCSWRLNIVGEGDLKKDYIKEAQELGIGGKVNFLGRIDDKELPSVYRRADVFVLPSVNQNEAFGIVLLEAMASGIPVVASALPGVRKVFSSGREGFLVNPGDAGDLALKLNSILSNPDRQRIMSKAARRLAEEKYSPERLKEGIKEILR